MLISGLGVVDACGRQIVCGKAPAVAAAPGASPWAWLQPLYESRPPGAAWLAGGLLLGLLLFGRGNSSEGGRR